MNFVTLDEFKKDIEYNEFIKNNPSTGTLKIEVFTAYKAIPIANTEILVTKDIGNNKVLFFRGFTDSSGMINNIQLPAPEENKDYKPGDQKQYTTYDITAIYEGFEKIKKYNVSIYGNTGVIQYIKMIPIIDMEGIENNGN